MLIDNSFPSLTPKRALLAASEVSGAGLGGAEQFSL